VERSPSTSDCMPLFGRLFATNCQPKWLDVAIQT
jgi:hypothetical protein